MIFPRRKCCLLVKKLFVVFALACGCVWLLNFLCFNGECTRFEQENEALSSLSDVIREANKLSSDDRREILMASVTSKANTKGIVIVYKYTWVTVYTLIS